MTDRLYQGGESVTISEEQPCDSLSHEEQMTETNDFIQQDAEAGNVIDILREHWTELVGRLMPSNRPLFAGAILKEENGNIVVVFKNNMNYKLAAKNIEENGVLKLRELAAQLTGETVKMVARIARPGEIEVMNNRATDEELSRINFHIDIEG